MLTNFHTHTNYCDGKDKIKDIVEKAISLNIQQLGFSSHSPLPFNSEWSLLNNEELKKYITEIENEKNKYLDKIEIYKGLEADYITGMTKNFNDLKFQYNLDYIIGSIHLVKVPETSNVWFIDGKDTFYIEGIKNFFSNNTRLAVVTYFNQIREMIETQEFDIIGHFDKIKLNNANRFFSENESWYKDEIMSVIDLIKQKDIIMEVNTRGYYQGKIKDLYPSSWIIEKAINNNIKIMINSDAHKTDELIKGFDYALKILKTYGCKSKVVRKNNKWEEVGL